MARPGLSRHRKFLRLARALGSSALARGSLELLWDQAYENGDAYLGDASDVELAADWRGEPGVLLHALVSAGGDNNAGFVDELQERPGHYEVHDLFDHAPEYVAKRRARERARLARGQQLTEAATLPDSVRRSLAKSALSKERAAAGRLGAQARWQLEGKRPPLASQRLANGATPAPAPAPAPGRDQIVGIRRRSLSSPDTPEGFDEFWNAYPRRKAKKAAVQAWKRIAPSAQLRTEILAAVDRHIRTEWAQRDPQYIPHPASWLNKERWRDEIDAPPSQTNDRPRRSHASAAPPRGWSFDDCPHEPRCMGQWRCQQLRDLDDARRARTGAA